MDRCARRHAMGPTRTAVERGDAVPPHARHPVRRGLPLAQRVHARCPPARNGCRAPTRSWSGSTAARSTSVRARSSTPPSCRASRQRRRGHRQLPARRARLLVPRPSRRAVRRLGQRRACSTRSPRSVGSATTSPRSVATRPTSRSSASRRVATASDACSPCPRHAGSSTAPSRRAARASTCVRSTRRSSRPPRSWTSSASRASRRSRPSPSSAWSTRRPASRTHRCRTASCSPTTSSTRSPSATAPTCRC